MNKSPKNHLQVKRENKRPRWDFCGFLPIMF